MIQRFFIYSLLALCFVLLTDYILSCGGHQHVQPKLKASFTVPTKFSWVKRETHSLAGTPISIPKQWKALHQFSQEKLLEVFYQVHSIASNTDDKKAEMIQPRIQHFDKTIKLLTSNDYFSNEFYLKHEITFTIALKQKNINKLKEKFETVSDPFHEDYTNYLTMKEIKNLIEPTKETIQTVLTWLKNYNDISVEKISKHNDFIVVKSTIETINQLFNIKLVPFIHQNNVLYGVVFRSESASYSLPDYLVHHIDFVSDLVKFPSEQLLWKKSVPPRNPQVMVTPSFLINKYNIQLPVGPSTKNRQSCAQFLDQYYSPSDLNLFFNQFNVLNGSKTPLRVIGPNNPNQPGVEASLDIQYLMGVAQNIPTDFISTGGRVNNGQEPFIDWAITVQQQGDDGAYTHSISYGDVESTIPRDYAERMNNELIKLAVSGRSVLFATGDDGVQCNAAGTRQEPNFPAGSPYVLSVGATEPYGEGEKSTSWSGGVFQDPFHEETNPNGIINLAVAENILSSDHLCKVFHEISVNHPLKPQHLNYTSFSGAPEFRKELVEKLFTKRIFKRQQALQENTEIKQLFEKEFYNINNYFVCNGGGNIIEQIGFAICNENEYVMIPSPMYLALENDFGLRFSNKVLPVEMDFNKEKNSYELTVDLIRKVYDKAVNEEGKIVKGFFLINPNNPTGDVFDRELVRSMIDFCKEKNIHFISDELYALSIFDKETEFISAASVMDSDDKDYVHIIYSFSKDFCLNGFRVGVLFTLNKEMQQVFNSCSYFNGCSSHTQQLLTNFLKDEKLLDEYLEINLNNLRNAYSICCDYLEKYNVKYVKARGGLFIWFNMTDLMKKYLSKKKGVEFNGDCFALTKEEEYECWLDILDNAKVNLSAGQFYFTDKTGWMRVCFTSVKSHILQKAFERVFSYLTQ
ncbi:hypothetical protein ABK040_013702 [Willaertia magna]